MADDTNVEWVDAGTLIVGDWVVYDGIPRKVDEVTGGVPYLRAIPGEPERVALSGRVLRVTGP